MSVLITDAESSVSLAIVRSLGEKNIRCICTSPTKFAVSFFSKYCAKRIITPSPKLNTEKFIDEIIKICKENQVKVLFPVRGPSTLAISKYKKEIEAYTIVPFEDFDKLKELYDKSSLVKYANKVKIPIPKTWIIKDQEDIENILDDFIFPIVLKASVSEGAHGVVYIRNKEELIEKYKELKIRYSNSKIILQEYINGVGYGCSVLFDFKSQPRAVFCHRRLRENPPTGGPSVARISIIWPELEELTIKLLKYIKWRGLAMVEYKVTSQGDPYLIEINPRFWGSLPLAIASGVDFPYMLYLLAIHQDIEPRWSYKRNILARRLIMGDLNVFFYYLINSKNKSKYIAEYFDFFNENVSYDICSMKDPLPVLGRIVWSLTKALGGGGMD